MITTDYIRLMARYNQWQNGNIFDAADLLTDDQRHADRGAFFGSIQGTLSHLLWGDSMWMHRFAGSPAPSIGIKESSQFCNVWPDLKLQRAAVDRAILDWAAEVSQQWIDGTTTWFSAAAGRQLSRPNTLLVAHFFNHQTHHRGQVHALLTGFGVRPGDTDLMLLPE